MSRSEDLPDHPIFGRSNPLQFIQPERPAALSAMWASWGTAALQLRRARPRMPPRSLLGLRHEKPRRCHHRFRRGRRCDCSPARAVRWRILILERGPRLRAEAENASAEAAFVQRRYRAKEERQTKAGRQIVPGQYHFVDGQPSSTAQRCFASAKGISRKSTSAMEFPFPCPSLILSSIRCPTTEFSLRGHEQIKLLTRALRDRPRSYGVDWVRSRFYRIRSVWKRPLINAAPSGWGWTRHMRRSIPVAAHTITRTSISWTRVFSRRLPL
ncbi:hypothetical protein AWB78_08137 [Caballeronia calidae]|uniref:Uncharacterized protein n=1 Tax=Caballeronia calidae TaxID=1777139 RepID=A0A158EIP8_9BURK|nr:hypothetical protein AWB78_08137 [Caballeronia calidae]